MTTDEAAIEAMARAMYEAKPSEWCDGYPDWDAEYPDVKATLRTLATAALAALREMEGRDG